MTDLGFVAGTVIETTKGSTRIEDLVVGDELVTTLGNTEVVSIFSEVADNLVNIVAQDTLLCTTPEQRVAIYRLGQNFEVEFEWVKACDVAQGEMLSLYSRPFPKVGWYDAKCTSVDPVEGQHVIYNIQVENETLVANDVVVHDCSPLWRGDE